MLDCSRGSILEESSHSTGKLSRDDHAKAEFKILRVLRVISKAYIYGGQYPGVAVLVI